MTHHLGGAVWRKSSRSGSEGNCVEVATNLLDAVAVRDSKDRDRGALMFDRRGWEAFVAGVRNGEFDI